MTTRWLLGLFLSLCMTTSQAVEEAEPLIDIYRVAGLVGEYSSLGGSLDADWALGSGWRWQLGAGYAHADSETDSLSVRQGHLALEWGANAFTTTLESDYRNDNGDIESVLLRLRTQWRGDNGSVAASYARRRIDVTFDLGPQLLQYVDNEQRTYSNEYGARFRFAPNAFALYASGAYWDYSDEIDRLGARLNTSQVPLAQRPLLQDRIQRIREQLGRATFRSLRLAGHLLEYSAAVGADYNFGEQLINLEYAREQETLTDSVIQSVEVGWLLPAGKNLDLELRVGGSDFEEGETAVYGTIALTWYRR